MASWQPSWVPAEAARFARAVVAAAGGEGGRGGKSLLWAGGRLAGYGISLGLEPVPEVLLHPSVIERFAAHAPGLSGPARRTLRTNLRFIARKVVPQLCPADLPLPRERAKPPYTPAQIDGYLTLAGAQPTAARRMRAAGVVCLGAGAGLIRSDLRHVRGSDICCRSGGVVVDVRGSRPRAVHVLARYHDTLLASAAFAGNGLVTGGTSPDRGNITTPLVTALAGGTGLPRLDTSRLRATWLADCAELLGLATFLHAAGITCSQRLGDITATLPPGSEADAVALLGGQRSASRPPRSRTSSMPPGARPRGKPSPRPPRHRTPGPADPDAPGGPRPRTPPGPKGEMFSGHHLNAAPMPRQEHGPAIPELARRMTLTACHLDPARALVPVLTRMPAAGIALGDILADSGYAHRDATAWAIPLRAAGAQLIQDLHPSDRGPQGTHEGAIIANGSLYCPATPKTLLELQPLARDATPEQITAHDTQAGELARHKLGRITTDDADGYHRVMCPAAMGKIRCPHRPDSMKLDRARPEVLTPPENPPACCTQQTITVPPAVAPKTRQKHDNPPPPHPPPYAAPPPLQPVSACTHTAKTSIPRSIPARKPRTLARATKMSVPNVNIDTLKCEDVRVRRQGLEPRTRGLRGPRLRQFRCRLIPDAIE